MDQKRCQSYTPHSIPFMEKPLALSELPKEEWVCHILEESGATFVSLEDFYEPSISAPATLSQQEAVDPTRSAASLFFSEGAPPLPYLSTTG